MWELIVLLAFLGSAWPETCPDRHAFNKINVRVLRERNDRIRKLESVSLYELDRFKVVDVDEATVPSLCEGMIRDLPRLESLSLIHVNLNEIHANAFKGVQNLTSLALSVNNLVHIRRNQFKNLENLRVLYLSANQIETIEEDSFADLPNLAKIYLNKNKIREIAAGWFSRSSLDLIDLSHNFVSIVRARVFKVGDSDTLEIRLQKNLIVHVDQGAVVSSGGREGVRLYLHLGGNELTKISKELVQSLDDDLETTLVLNANKFECLPDEVLSMLRVSSLSVHLDSNPLTCECMEKFKKYFPASAMQSGSVPLIFYNTTRDCQFFDLNTANW